MRCAQAARIGELDQQLQRLVVDALPRKIEQQIQLGCARKFAASAADRSRTDRASGALPHRCCQRRHSSVRAMLRRQAGTMQDPRRHFRSSRRTIDEALARRPRPASPAEADVAHQIVDVGERVRHVARLQRQHVLLRLACRGSPRCTRCSASARPAGCCRCCRGGTAPARGRIRCVAVPLRRSAVATRSMARTTPSRCRRRT